VLTHGGNPRVLIDGVMTTNSAPTVVEVPPGKHVVSVRGAMPNAFAPPDFTLTLAEGDTQTVVFVRQGQRQQGAPDSASLTPAQRARYQRLQQLADSARKAKRPPA